MTAWPLSERPREKLLNLGPKYLTDAELLAIFLRTGVPGKTALDLARELLSEFGDLKKLLKANPLLFYKKSGIGKAKLAMIKAGLELGRRYLEERFSIGEILNNSGKTKQFLIDRLQDHSHEVFACLFLDTHNRLIEFEELFQGTIDESNVYPREVVKKCLSHNATKIILAHNHPSGRVEPSASDKKVTKMLKEALLLINVQVLDHIIIGGKSCFSFSEQGLL